MNLLNTDTLRQNFNNEEMKIIIENDVISKTWIAYVDGYREVIAEGLTVQESIDNLHKDINLCGGVVENFAHELTKEPQTEALNKHSVGGRSEQLVAFLRWVGDGYDFENNAEAIVKRYLDEGN